MAKTDKDGCWLDARGKATPVECINKLVIYKDKLVEDKIRKALKLSKQLMEFKQECTAGIDNYLKKLAKTNKVRENWKGNIALKSFDESMVIERAMNDRIEFSEGLQLAKAQIDVWLKNRIGSLDQNLSKVVSQTFNVDKRGRINTAMVLKLMQLEIDEPEWQKAMAILKESISVASTKMYIRFKVKRNGECGESWENISLDFANVGDSDAKD
ncbi:MAG: DUF3164 family protein [Fibromonadaceae bacterium]|jgi:hypothetical protein|nr:DUF3164 family protein [Fibromonadaceae bacterium]